MLNPTSITGTVASAAYTFEGPAAVITLTSGEVVHATHDLATALWSALTPERGPTPTITLVVDQDGAQLHLRSFTLETPQLALQRGTIVRVAWFPPAEPFAIVLSVNRRRRGGSAYILHPSGGCWTSTADLAPVAQAEIPRGARHSRAFDALKTALAAHMAAAQPATEGA